MHKIILASTSPRRKQLMELLNIDFQIEPSDYEEDMTLDMPPEELVQFLALEKARAVAQKHQGEKALVIGSDTIVLFGGQVLGKPRDKAQAGEMLGSLSSNECVVVTGLAVIDTAGGKEIQEAHNTTVGFRKMTKEEISGYVETGEPMDKAGAFAIQELGGIFIDKVEGNYFSAIGLPLSRVVKILEEFGIGIF